MTHNSFQELELWLGHLEQVPYRHHRALQFLSYLYDHPDVIASYSQIIALALETIRLSSQMVTDEPAIYSYQCAALMAYFTQPSLPEWRGIPAGEADRIAWLILQYYPSLDAANKLLVQQWASSQLLQQQLYSQAQWALDTSTIIQYLANAS